MAEEILVWTNAILWSLALTAWILVGLRLVLPDRIERAINRRIKQAEKELKLARKRREGI